MKLKRIVLVVFVLMMSIIGANAITTLTSCGTPNGGWLNNEIYIVDLQQDVSKANYGTDNYCFNLNNQTTGISFRSITPINLIDKTMFRIDTRNTNLNIENFDITSKSNPRSNLFVEYYNSFGDATQTVTLDNTFRNIRFNDKSNVDKNVFYFGSAFSVNSNIVITYDGFNIINSKFDVPNLNLVNYNNPIRTIYKQRPYYTLKNKLIFNNNGNIIIDKKNSANIQGHSYWDCDSSCAVGDCVSVYCNAYSSIGNTLLQGSNSIVVDKIEDNFINISLSNSMVKGYSFQDTNFDGFADDSSIYNNNSRKQFTNMRTFLELFGTTYIQDASISTSISNDNNRNIVDLNGFAGMGYNGKYYNFNSGAEYNTISCDVVNYQNISGIFANILYNNNLQNCDLSMSNNDYLYNLTSNNGIIEVQGENNIYNNIFNVNNNISLDVIKDTTTNGLTGINIISNTFTKTISGLDGLNYINIKPHKTSRITDNYFGTSATGNVTYMNFNNAVLDNGQNLLIEKNQFTNVNQETDKYLMRNLNSDKVTFMNNFIGKNLQISNVGIKLYGTKKYYYQGKLYTFNVGNYYENNINCVDNNIDGICDSPYSYNGIVDLYPLYSYPYNYEQYIASAINSVNVTTDYNVTIIQPLHLQQVTVNGNDKTYNMIFQHNSNVNMDSCKVYLNDNVIGNYYDVDNTPKNFVFTDLQDGNSYTTKVDCSIGNITKSSTTNVFSVVYGVVSNNGGGSSGGGSSSSPYDCKGNEVSTYTCSNGNVIDLLVCNNGKWNETGNKCDTCAWYNPFCNNANNTNSNISQSSNSSLFGFFKDLNIFGNATKKKICDITFTSNKDTFTSDGDLIKLTILNNEDGSYTPNYKFVSINDNNSAIPSMSITNPIGTIQKGQTKEVGLKYKLNTFSSKTSSDKIILTSDNCADVELKINSNLGNQTSFIGNNLGGGSLFGPNVKQLSELTGTGIGTDLLFYSLIGGGFTSLNWKKKYVKGNSKKKQKRNKIIKSIIILILTLFSGLGILIILNMIF